MTLTATAKRLGSEQQVEPQTTHKKAEQFKPPTLPSKHRDLSLTAIKGGASDLGTAMELSGNLQDLMRDNIVRLNVGRHSFDHPELLSIKLKASNVDLAEGIRGGIIKDGRTVQEVTLNWKSGPPTGFSKLEITVGRFGLS